jgi:uncharacterized protein
MSIFLFISVAVFALLWFGQRKLIYFPSTAPVAAPAGMTEVSFETQDRLRLKGWLAPAAEPGNGMTVLVANGNGGDRSHRAPLARALVARGFTVLLFDYRGYGGNPGSPSESGLYKDIKAAYGYLVERFRPQEVILFGESLGSAVATHLAAEEPVGGLVLRSPFVDLPSVGARHYPFLPVRLLLRDRFPLAEKLTRVKAPIAVVYGTRDSIVPPEQSIAVARRVPVPPVAVEGADHNDAELLDGEQLIDAVDGVAALAAGHDQH